jgi:hypothetical protein
VTAFFPFALFLGHPAILAPFFVITVRVTGIPPPRVCGAQDTGTGTSARRVLSPRRRAVAGFL